MTSPPWTADTKKRAEFASKVRTGGADECWLWTGPAGEYAVMYWRSHGTNAAHRIAVQLARGRLIAPGLCIDHVCENKLCMNPAHLDEVTREENCRRAGERRQHCARGHARTEHGYLNKRGDRLCRACDAMPNKQRLTRWSYPKPDLGYAVANEVQR